MDEEDIKYEGEKRSVTGWYIRGNQEPEWLFDGPYVVDMANLKRYKSRDWIRMLDDQILQEKLFIRGRQDRIREEKNERVSSEETIIFLEVVIESANERLAKLLALKKRYRIRNITKEYESTDLSLIRAVPISNVMEFTKGGYARCIWHNEKTPSMKYYKKDNRIYCFGCHKRGSIIDVVMQKEGVEAGEAIQIIKNTYL